MFYAEVTISNNNFVESESDNDAEESIQRSLDWMERHHAPWETVKMHWSTTYNARRKDIEKYKDKVLSNLFAKWNALQHPLGHELMNFDFNKMSLTQVLLDMDTWNKFMTILLECVGVKETDETANNLLNKYKDTQNNDGKSVNKFATLLKK